MRLIDVGMLPRRASGFSASHFMKMDHVRHCPVNGIFERLFRLQSRSIWPTSSKWRGLYLVLSFLIPSFLGLDFCSGAEQLLASIDAADDFAAIGLNVTGCAPKTTGWKIWTTTASPSVQLQPRARAILGLENPGKESSPSKLDYIVNGWQEDSGMFLSLQDLLPLWSIPTRMYCDHAWIEEETAWSLRPLRACEIGCWMTCHCTLGEQIEYSKSFRTLEKAHACRIAQSFSSME